jgi:hypothetical protein
MEILARPPSTDCLEVPKVYSSTFGRSAVIAANADKAIDKDTNNKDRIVLKGEWIEIQAGEVPPEVPGDILVGTLALRSLSSELKRARRHLSKLDEEQRETLDEYCYRYVPQQIRQSRKSTSKARWSDWLAKGADNNQLLDFLEWNVAEVEDEQSDPELEQELQNEREEYKNAVLQGINDGWLHTDAYQALMKVDDVNIYVGDLFNTVLNNMRGYHDQRYGHVVIASRKVAQLDSSESYVPVIAKHELNHAVLASGEVDGATRQLPSTSQAPLILANRKLSTRKIGL